MLNVDTSRGVDGRRETGRGELRLELAGGVRGTSRGVDRKAERTGFTLGNQ